MQKYNVDYFKRNNQRTFYLRSNTSNGVIVRYKMLQYSFARSNEVQTSRKKREVVLVNSLRWILIERPRPAYICIRVKI